MESEIKMREGEACVRLWKAVVNRGIFDAVGLCNTSDGSDPIHRRMSTRHIEECEIGWKYICEAAGYHHDYIRRKTNALRKTVEKEGANFRLRMNEYDRASHSSGMF